MKTHHLLRFVIVFAALIFNSCTKDIDENYNDPLKPYFKAMYQGEVSEIYSDMPLGGVFEVHLIGQKSNAALKSVRFMEEGYTLPTDRILINGQEITNNPVLLNGREIYSLEMIVQIKSHEEVGLRKRYTIILDDADGNKSSIVLWLNTIMELPQMTISANEDHEIIVPPGELISVKISSKKGSFALKNISVLLKPDFKCHSVPPDFVKPTEIYFGFTMIHVDSNPIILNKTDSKGFEKTLFVRVPSVPGVYAYCIMMEDTFKNTVDDWFRVKVMDFEDSLKKSFSEVK